MKRMLLLALAVAGCAKSGDASKAAAPAMKRLPRVTKLTLALEPLTWSIQCLGSVEPKEQVSVAAGVPGVVTDVDFKEGDPVTRSKVLCRVDAERYKLEETRAKAEKTRADRDAEKAKNEYAQRVPLHEKKYITDEELAQFKAAWDGAVADQERAAAAMSLAEKASRDSSVKPPLDGVINAKMISTGEYVKAETVVAMIVDLSSLHIRFSVPQTEGTHLKAGLEVTFTSEAAPGRSFKATVFWVSQMADAKSRTLECLAELEPAASVLKPGYSGTVTLVMEERAGTLVVPSEAVQPTERGFVAFVLDKDGKTARERKLKLGVHADGDRVEVVDGLKEKDVLIVRGASALRDGMEVEIAK